MSHAHGVDAHPLPQGVMQIKTVQWLLTNFKRDTLSWFNGSLAPSTFA